MSITIPGLRREHRPRPKHRAIDEVDRLRIELARKDQAIEAANGLIGGLKASNDQLLAKATRYDEAEARATAAEWAMAEQTEELTALRAFKANVTSVSDLDVLTAPDTPASTADRFDTGPVLRAGKRPVPTWAGEADGETTVSIPIPQPPQPATAA